MADATIAAPHPTVAEEVTKSILHAPEPCHLASIESDSGTVYRWGRVSFGAGATDASVCDMY